MAEDVHSVRRVDRDRGPMEVQHGEAFTFQFDVYKHDLPEEVSAVEFTLYESSPDDPWTDGAAGAVVPGRDGVTPNRISFPMLPGVSGYPASYAEGVVGLAKVTTAAGAVFTYRWTFDLCRKLLLNTLTEDELFARTPKLRDMRSLGVEEGTPDATAGDNKSFTAAALGRYPVEFYTGGEVEVIGGTNEGTWREVVAFDNLTGLVTVGVPWDDPMDETSVYRIRASWLQLINEAWAELRWRIRSRGRRPALMMDSSDFRVPHVYLATAMAFESAANSGEPEDVNWSLGQQYRQMFDDTWEFQNWRYDESESGKGDAPLDQFHVTHMARY